MEFIEWFLEFLGLGPEEFSKLSPVQQSLIETMPFVLVAVIILGAIWQLSSIRKKGEEGGEELDELEKEIRLIRELQKKSLWS